MKGVDWMSVYDIMLRAGLQSLVSVNVIPTPEA